MLKAVSEKDLLRLNPHIDRNKLSESLSLSEQLANNGVKMSEYRLASPYSRPHNKKTNTTADVKRTKKYRGL